MEAYTHTDEHGRSRTLYDLRRTSAVSWCSIFAVSGVKSYSSGSRAVRK